MPITVPPSHQDLLESAVVVVLATITPAGRPHTSAVWRWWDGELVHIVAAANTQKVRNLRATPYASILALDPQNAGRYLELRGSAETLGEDGVIEMLDKLAQLYTGDPEYYGYAEPLEEKGKTPLVWIRIRPDKAVIVGA